MVVSVVLLILFLVYNVSIIVLCIGFNRVKQSVSFGLKPKIKFTIIVPFRNEAENLPILLRSFSRLNYPQELLEVILVDDDSDEFFQVPNLDFQVSVVKNNRISNSPKKDAITTAMQGVTSNWVVTTDADCFVPENWLLAYDNYIQNNQVEMVAGAVTYQIQDSFLHHFQQVDLASLQGATIGSFGLNKGFMCNGANFAYTKNFFHELNGFEGNDSIASGDDVFLLQKAVAYSPEKVRYLKSKEAIVITQPLNHWEGLFHQRVRWASKAGSYQSQFGVFLGFVVFFGNLSVLLGILFCGFNCISFRYFVLLVFSKVIIDSVLIYKTNRFLTQNKIRYLILSSLFYPFFSTAVALYSLFGKYEWKGRTFKK